MKSRPFLILLGLVLLALAQRGPVITAPRLDLFGEYVKAPEAVVVGEEEARVNVAMDLVQGPVVPLIDYQYANYCGGSLVVSLMLAPMVAVLGPNIWTLRLLALGFHLVGLICIFMVLDRWASRRAAIFGGVLWALAAPGFVINTMVVWGTHVESNIVALCTLWLFMHIHSTENKVPLKRGLLGLLQGLNVYIGYQAVLHLCMLAFFDLHPKRFPKPKALAAQVAGFAIGFSPWLWYNLRNNWAGLEIYGKDVSENVVSVSIWQKWKSLFTEYLPDAQWFPKAFEGAGPTLNWVYFIFLLAAAIFGTYGYAKSDRKAPHPGQVAGIFLLGFILAFGVTGFAIYPHEDAFGYRYPQIMTPWLIIAAAVGWDRQARASELSRKLVWASFLLIGGVCLYGSAVGLTDYKRFGNEQKISAHRPSSHTLWLFASYREFPERYPEVLRSLQNKRTPEEVETTLRDLGNYVHWLGADQPGFGPEQLNFAAQLRHMREVLIAELPPEQHHLLPVPGAPR
ncbi:MAG: hypothetical protein P1V35_05795 [Planctomycetota bacterium]|nr:hypothetical protein [Planctomycetota bacterium]